MVGDSTTQIADLSTNGFSPDGDGDPSNNDEPSPIILNLNIDPNKPAIGVALAVVDTLEFDDKAYDITYVAIVQNLGGVVLKDTQMIDSLSKTFADTLKYEIVGTPMVNAEGTIKISTGIALEEFHIYNRWGYLVYTDQNENILTQGWNGEANTGILSTTAGVPDGTIVTALS